MIEKPVLDVDSLTVLAPLKGSDEVLKAQASVVLRCLPLDGESALKVVCLLKESLEEYLGPRVPGGYCGLGLPLKEGG